MIQIKTLTQNQMDEIKRSWKIVNDELVWARDTNRGKKINDKVGLSTKKTGHQNVFLYIDGKQKGFVLSRIIWFLTTGEYPIFEIDHIDRNPKNNKFSNLRLANRSENNCNKRGKINRLGLKGTYQDIRTGKWHCQIQKNGKVHGRYGFNTTYEAYAVRMELAKQLHGEFTN